MKNEMKRLEEIDERIQEIMCDWGLQVIPIDFEIVPAQKMLEIMAYGMPINFRHWSMGRDYERLRTIYEHSGAGLPYETILNTVPPKAFLMETNPFSIQVLVIAHVYAHVDFFNQNQHFAETPKDILAKTYETTKRFDWYEQHYGLSRLEPLIDAGLALQFNIDPDIHKRKETKEEQIARLFGSDEDRQKPVDHFSELYPRKKKDRPDFQDLAQRTPLEPERDVLGYILQNSPKPLEEREQDVLSAIRNQGLYLYPQIRTKIINEGWAAYWHEKAMRKLFEEGYLTSEEHGYFAQYHSAVLAPNPFQINPYLVGKRIFEDIKERWDKGKFGKVWQECQDEYEKENWDTKLGKGNQKIFAVRKVYTDRMFIEHFLTDELIHDLELYIYEERPSKKGGSELVIVEKRPEVIRQQLKELYADRGQPRILVQNGNFMKKRELYLQHVFEGAPLDYEYLHKTLEHVYFMWGKNVHLETMDVIIDRQGRMNQRKVVHHYNGKTHTKTDKSSGSTCKSCISFP